MKHGISISPSSNHIISVTLSEYVLNTLSIKDNSVAEYGVSIKAHIEMTSPDGDTRKINVTGEEFTKAFIAGENPQSIQSQKEQLNKEALKELSQLIISELYFL